MALDPQLMQNTGAAQNYASLMPKSYGPAAQPKKSGWQNFWDKAYSGFFGSPGEYEDVSLFQPHQQVALDQILSSGLGNLQNPYEGFDPIQNEYMRMFREQMVPELTEQFTGSTGASLSSPSFASQLGGSAASLASRLAALKSEYGLQNRRDALSQAQLGLTPQYEKTYNEGQQGFLGQVLPTLAEGATMYATGGLSGAAGVADLIKKGVSAFKGSGSSSNALSEKFKNLNPSQKQQVANALRSLLS